MSERPVDPDLVDVLEGREEDLLLRLNTATPARVQRYDAALQVVDAVPLVRGPVPRADGTYDHEDLPVVPSVPVVWPRVGAWSLTMALAPGDTGLLVCCDGDVGTWRAGSGDVVDPVNLQRHHLSHAVFLPGLATRARALTAPASGTAAVVLGHDTSGSRVTFRADGSVEVTTATGTPLLLQGGTQPFVNGTLYADALGTFLNVLASWVAAVGVAIAGVAAYAGTAAAAVPLLGPAATTLGPTLTPVAAATTSLATAITNFAAARSAYLSTRIRGS
jgi:hypothetical protein